MPIFPIDKLMSAMDIIVKDPALQPKKGLTYCNIAMFKLVQALGFNLFWNQDSDRPMMANEMVDYMDNSPTQFSKFFDPMMAYEYSNSGHLVIAGLKSMPHGHVSAIYPSQDLVTSGKWKTQVPKNMSVGKKNEITGINFSYSDIPNFYLCL